MKKQIIFLMFLLPVVFNSCKNYNRIEGNHHVSEETRSTPTFTEVNVSGDFEVFLTTDSFTDVVVEAEENLIPYIETEVKNNTLHIDVRPHRSLENHYPMKIYVSAPAYSGIRLSGSGSVSTDSISGYSMNFDVSGSGRITSTAYFQKTDAEISGSGHLELTGTTDECSFDISGSGKISAYTFVANRCFCDISGSGKMYVNVIDLLDVRISGSGSVYYIGNPAIQSHITGSGQISHN
jgi:hypothetical protein